MKNEAVLVTSLSRKIPLVEAVRKAADKIGHFTQIHGSDFDASCVGQYFVDHFWHCPPQQELKITDFLHYCEQHHIGGIIPTRDGELLFFARHRIEFEKNGLHLLVSSEKTVEICLNKMKFYQFLQEKGFPVIATNNQIEEGKTNLYVVKENLGAGSQHLALAVSKQEAEQHAKKMQNPIFQPYVKGREWSIDLYRTRKGKIMGVVSRSRDLVLNGESQVTTTANFPKLEQLCEKMAHALQIEGHAVFQVIEDSEQNLHIVECNPRFGGASTCSLAVGLDSFSWFFLECLNRDTEGVSFLRSKQQIRQIRYSTDKLLVWK